MVTTTPGGPAAPAAPAAPHRDDREVMRDEAAMRPRILAALAEGPHTVPEIALAIGAPTHETVFWVMAMRRYGWLAEIKGSEIDGYVQYQPTGRTL
jgi:predicted Rossmann fold nucleotide-binding protein DprA/Smf involved in DNA uptake